jgi:DNA-binding XRE family transcriptional regulator
MPVVSRGLKRSRVLAGYTQKQLALLVNLAPQTLADYEAGKKWPRLDTARALASILDSSIDELFPAERVPLLRRRVREAAGSSA